LWRVFWFWGLADFLRIVYGEEQELAEEVAAVIALAGKRAVPIGAFREPEVHGVVLEADRAVFDELVVAREANLWHGAHRIGFDGEDLRAGGVDPRAAL
jgi:hypothetical protein